MKILLIISGSVAAYKAAELARELKKKNHSVTAILTKGGAEFITPLQISSLTGTKTYTHLWAEHDADGMEHIHLSRDADLVLVAPASADIIAKMAHGMADDLATTTLLASNKPIYVAPAMNVEMWNKPATQRNIEQLKADGVRIIMPREGELACGEQGQGKMAELEEILKVLKA
jgi:phosphopantothenoylcysteine decarboxylase / phosphopantothenate---cysteine ligase